MVIKNKLFTFVLVLFSGLGGFANAELIVNEVMSNEPGGATSREWIELLNTDTTANFSLVFYSMDADGTTLSFQFDPFTVRGDPFIVICQNLISFESYWGDNSGIWGDDTTMENYPLFEKTNDFSLSNDDGTVKLYYIGNEKSSLSWTSAGGDGVSWERFSIDSSAVYSSVDPTGSTPGRINSRTPLPFDLALDSFRGVLTDSGTTELQFKIINVGLETVSGDSLFLYIDPEQDSIVELGDLIVKTQIPDLDAGDMTMIILNFEFDQFYINLLAQLLPDDRNNNNTQLFMAPGKMFPPIILSEFLADPTVSSSNEWIELKNRSDREIDITNWWLEKNDARSPIAANGYTMQSGEYIILCRDSLDFVDYYDFIDYTIIKPTGWPTLRNTGDTILLIDNFGTVADSIAYDSTFGDNFTWGRGEASGSDTWGRSAEAGGTPGHENIINYPASASDIKITVSKNPFSPNVDGEMTIGFVLPPGTFNMTLYDVEGRVVKTFIDNHYAYNGEIMWAGKSDGGRRLPIGIYILFVEVVGKGHYKQTIVIAR